MLRYLEDGGVGTMAAWQERAEEESGAPNKAVSVRRRMWLRIVGWSMGLPSAVG